MTYRNGIVADTLRKAGYPQGVIFGLNLPQLAEISNRLKGLHSPAELAELATALWSDKNVREARLLAAYLLDTDLPISGINAICSDVQTPEEADLLAFRWLRHSPHASTVATLWKSMTEPPFTWLSQALARFIR